MNTTTKSEIGTNSQRAKKRSLTTILTAMITAAIAAAIIIAGCGDPAGPRVFDDKLLISLTGENDTSPPVTMYRFEVNIECLTIGDEPCGENFGTVIVNGAPSTGDLFDTYHHHNSTVTVTASPGEGYEFLGWPDALKSMATEEPTDTSVTFVINAGRRVSANFQRITEPPPPPANDSTYLIINVTCRPTGGNCGSVRVNDALLAGLRDSTRYHIDDTVTITATPQSSYEFLGWPDGLKNAAVTHSDASVTLAMNTGRVVNAIFEKQDVDTTPVTMHRLSFSIPGNRGQIMYNWRAYSNGDTVLIPDSAHVSLMPSTTEEYAFTGWEWRTPHGTFNSTNDILHINAITTNITVTANFVPSVSVTQFDVEFRFADTSLIQTIRVDSGGIIETFPSVPAREGYIFIGWFDILENYYEPPMTVTANITLTARFEIDNTYGKTGEPNTNWYHGNTSASTFTISTADELAGLAHLVNNAEITFDGKTINLNRSIDLESYPYPNAQEGFRPIGMRETGNREFSGVFDGNGHVIKNLYVNRPGADNQGLFGIIINGKVENLGLENAAVTGKSNVGGIVGYIYGGSVTQCHVTGAVSGASYVGGIAGEVVGGSSIASSYSTAAVTGYDPDAENGSRSFDVGGIAGIINEASSIEKCYSAGEINGSHNVGGVVGGVNMSSTVSDSYSTAKVIGKGTGAGGIAGYVNSGSKITRCYSIGAINAHSSVGGIVGSLTTVSEVKYCIALNSQVVRIGGVATHHGRVVGSIGQIGADDIYYNFARAGLPDQNGAVVHNGKDGGSLLESELLTNIFINTANWPAEVWNVSPGIRLENGMELPTLKSQRENPGPRLPPIIPDNQ